MLKQVNFLFFLALFLSSSSSQSGEVLIMYVDSKTVECTGLVPQTCLLVKYNLDDEWEFFYSSINGFMYEPDFLYKLRVSRRHVSNPPADAPSYTLHLLEVLEKVPAL